MKLHTAMASPFGRKIWIAILHHGLGERCTRVEARMADANDPMYVLNPLGKMPVLVTDSGEVLHDSPVIAEYLDGLLGGLLVPAAPRERLAELQFQALADGIMEAGALIVSEGRDRPPHLRHQPSVERQRDKIRRGIAHAAAHAPEARRIQIAAISLACALGFLDRRAQFDWRNAHPGLIEWLDAFRAACPAFDATRVPPDPDWVCP